MNNSDATALLRHMVAIPSESRQEGALAAFLLHQLRQYGFETGIDTVGNIIASKGQGEDLGVLLGHIDTVKGNIPVRVEDGVLYGRGSVDAKGSLAAFIVALSRLDAKQLAGKVTIIGCVEEEVASSRGAHHVVERYAPKWAVIGEPSGWDSITLGYKGHLSLTVSLEQGQQHGAHEQLTASERMTQVWQVMGDFCATTNVERKRLFDQLMVRLTRMSGGMSLAGTDRAELKVQCRLPLDMPPEVTREQLMNLLRGKGVEVEFDGGIAAWSGPRTTDLHRAFLGAIRKRDGRARCLLKTGTADLNVVAPRWGCPALAYGPGDAALDHTPNEHIHFEEFFQSIAVLEQVLGKMAIL